MTFDKTLTNPAATIAEANEDRASVAERRAFVAADERAAAFKQAKQCGVTFEEFLANPAYYAAKLEDMGF
jgi:hypothetical protein